ncbi:MAG: LysR family transcriptional regulator [Gordonia sp. (in: high G+C Gram-positive bacteria)]
MAKSRLSLDHLRTFSTVYRAGSFSAASRLLGISQPTVTNHIRVVEDHFGGALFARQADGTTPTAAAHEVMAQIGAHMDHMERLMSGRGPVGTAPVAVRSVSLGGPSEFVSALVLPVLAGVRTSLPVRRVDITLGESRGLMEKLEAGRLDLVVTTVRPRNAELRCWPLADEEFWLVGAPELGLRGASFSQIDAAPLVAYSADLPIVRRYWNTVFDAEPRFDPILTLPDLQGIQAAVVAGVGISVLPSYLVAEAVADGRLERLDDVEEPPINTVFLAASNAMLTARPHTELVAELIVRGVKALDRF